VSTPVPLVLMLLRLLIRDGLKLRPVMVNT
jgi:hypothetical protein